MRTGRFLLGAGVITAVALSSALALSVTPGFAASGSHSRVHSRLSKTKITWRYGLEGCSGGGCDEYLQISHAGTGDRAWAEIRNGPGDNNEHWYSIYLGDGQYAFQNVNSGKCLNDFSGHLTGHVDQYSCGNYPRDSRWYEDATTPPTPKGYGLQNVATGMYACLGTDRWVVLGVAGSGSCFWH